jgi:hypothetical protein
METNASNQEWTIPLIMRQKQTGVPCEPGQIDNFFLLLQLT